jgi:hypothetical protein
METAKKQWLEGPLESVNSLAEMGFMDAHSANGKMLVLRQMPQQ